MSRLLVLIILSAGKQDYKDVPVCIPLSVPAKAARETVVDLAAGKQRLQGQLTAPGIVTENIKPRSRDLVRRDLHFILPALKAGQSLTLEVRPRPAKAAPDPVVFSWKDKKGEYAELSLADLRKGSRRPVLRYMYKAYDDSSPEKRDRTYKVFHHLYDPAGKRFVTNGGHTDLQPGEKKKLLYPHHRGLMYAFNRISYDGKQADTWHCTKGAHQSNAGFRNVEAGPVLGRHRVAVDWYGQKGDHFAWEERELTVYNIPGGTLVEFASRLKTFRLMTHSGLVKLDGDPQHAGFQFRASNDVADKTAKQTYFLRPDGKGKPGETRNWEPKTGKGPVDLPWDAMSFVLDGLRYTVAYLNHPKNPKPSRFSERDYGRFGCYFPYELTPDRPLVVNYRVWLQEGEMTGPGVEVLRRGFVSPPVAMVKGD